MLFKTHLLQILVAALLLIVICSAGGLAERPGIGARVDYVKSGQSLELLSKLNAKIAVMEVRLAGIQAPDLRQEPWGVEARQCLSELVDGWVRVEPQTPVPDHYNRLWADVWADDQLVNAAVLAQGCAFLDGDRRSQQRYGEALVYAQEEARLLGRGIWASENPLRETPNSFRQRLASP